MDDHEAAAQSWRTGLRRDLERTLGRLEAEWPVTHADAEFTVRWALLTADVCSAIAELSEPCGGPSDAEQPRPLRAPVRGATQGTIRVE
jgi:hypothetical protein